MLGVVDKKQLPGKMTQVKHASQPISIPIKREYAYSSPPSFLSTPPNDFMSHLQKRMTEFATSPGLVYNLRN